MGAAARVLLEDAAAAGTSDVHLNPGPGGLDALYRIDGVLAPVARIEGVFAERFVGRLKVLAGLPTYRRDIPQDGAIPASEAGGRADVRISILPTIHGEKAVLRFFQVGTDAPGLEGLGFSDAIRDRLRVLVSRPEGATLLTGPSGSGKTTTIYALLGEILGGPEGTLRHVVTIEDPVERALPGVTQTQVNPLSGLSFGTALRSILRHDPQVIMVGEIRDRETAQVAMEAGLTGHLVISTVHAGTAAGVVSRLLEMGVESHVLFSSLSAVLAQRLLRSRCSACAGGCAACRQTGYAGRRVVAELLEAGDWLRDACGRGSGRTEIEALAVRRGMLPLADAARRLVAEGVTTPEEVRRVMG